MVNPGKSGRGCVAAIDIPVSEISRVRLGTGQGNFHNRRQAIIRPEVAEEDALAANLAKEPVLGRARARSDQHNCQAAQRATAPAAECR